MISHFEQSIPFITWLQQFSPELDPVFLFFTRLADEQFFLILLPLVFWCLNRQTGAKLAIMLFLSVYLNAVSKNIMDQPRPFLYSDLVKQLREVVSDRGFPSGHTQQTVFIWCYLSLQFKRTWLWIISGVMLIFVPLSRVYLGVHFPVDLLGGLFLGLLVLFAALCLAPKAEKWLTNIKAVPKMLIATLLPCFLMLLYRDKTSITIMSTLAGFSAGLVLERQWIQFEVSNNWRINIMRYIAGMIGLVIIWLGLRIIFESFEPSWLFRIIRYIMCGLWVGYGAPWLFDRYIKQKEIET